MNNIDDRYLKGRRISKKNSLKFDDNQWEFEITDESKYVIKVVYTKSLPSLIEENKGIIVEGRMGKDNLFIAEIVLAKHDENYMPQSAIDKLKEEGSLERKLIDCNIRERFFILLFLQSYYFILTSIKKLSTLM